MSRNMILSGGVAHDYSTTSPILAEVLHESGIESEIHEDFTVLEDGSLSDFDMLTLNCVRWTCDQRPEWQEEWHFELSSRARRDHAMQVLSASHPITQGVTDFVIMDELYTNPRTSEALQPLIESTWKETKHPILWARDYGPARVCYNAMGHGVEAFEHPVNRLLLQRGALWILDRLGTSPSQQNGGTPGQ